MADYQPVCRPVLIRCIILVAISISVAACTVVKEDKVPELTNAIVGKWREIHGPATIQFFEEGTVILTGKDKTLTAYYKVLNNEQLRIEAKFNPKAAYDPGRIVNFSIHQDQLTISDPQETTRYKKQK